MDNEQDAAAPRTGIGSHLLPWLLALFLFALLLLLVAFAEWRSSSVGPQVQVPMFYDAHYLFPRPWTQEQAAPGVPDPSPLAVYGENRISQSFIAGSDNLSAISLWLAGQQDSVARATLADDSGGMWQTDIPLRAGYDGDVYSISFPPLPQSEGRRYTFSLTSSQATVEQPLLARSVGGDRLGDSLHMNEFIRPGNLAIAAYAAGMPGRWWLDALGEQLLPAVFRLRLQQYKPAPFKGALFSWLLLTTAGLSAVLLVLAAPGRQTPEQSVRRSVARSLGWFLAVILGCFLIWQLGSGRARIFTGPASSTAQYSPARAADFTNATPRVITDLTNDLWTAVRVPEARFVTTDVVQSYPAIRVPGDSQVRYALIVPPDSRLRIAHAAEGLGEISFIVRADDVPLMESVVTAADGVSQAALSWQELDLSPWAGQGVILSLETSLVSGEAAGVWLMPQVLTDASWVMTAEPVSKDYLPVGTRYDESVELLGMSVSDALPQAGEALAVTLWWRPLQAADRYGKVFVHLLDANGDLVAQHDGAPVNGSYPFAIWPPGTTIRDDHILPIDRQLTPGPYRLEIGIYDPDTLLRWPAENSDGTEDEQGRAAVELSFEVQP